MNEFLLLASATISLFLGVKLLCTIFIIMAAAQFYNRFSAYRAYKNTLKGGKNEQKRAN